MRTLPSGWGGLRKDQFFSPEFIVQISWDDADTDYTYLTSSPNANLPVTSPAVDSIQSVVMDISGQTQKINPDIATSTIGSVRISVLDRTDDSVSPPSQLVTDKIFSKLSAGDGLRGKVIRVYVGYKEVPFTSYDLRLTYVIDEISYADGMYTISASDIQRRTREKVFGPDESNLESSIDENALIIPVTTSDTSKFPLVTRAGTDSNFPSQHITFIKIEEEVICINSQPQFDTTNGWHVTAIQRGALGTRAVPHTLSEGAANSRKPKITEHVFLEGPAPKVVYAIFTGLMLHGDNKIESFDFSTWTPTNTPLVSPSSVKTPVGWGSAYLISDDSTINYELITSAPVSDGYVHGEVWTASLFVKKETAAGRGRIDIDFGGGAAGSERILVFDPVGGTIVSSGGANSTGTNQGVLDFDADWWYVHVSAYSTTTGTTFASMSIFPAVDVAGSADVGSLFVFGASLSKGDHMGMSGLPIHWHLGIKYEFVRLSDFKALGPDYWNLSDDTGRPARIENPGNQDGKRFVEKEVLIWMGAFLPVYTTGEIGIKRLTRILSDGAYQIQLDGDHVVSYSPLRHSMKSVINIINVKWNYVDLIEDFTKENLLIDETSISIHKRADRKEFEFKTVHTGVHTDESLLAYFDTLRDRYSGPPLEMSLRLLPSLHTLEVGDTAKVVLPQVRDFNTGESLSRTFEIQQITTNWSTGQLDAKMFGSSLAAGTLQRTALSSVMLDQWYTSEGTNLTSVLTIVAGVVTVSGPLTGTANMHDAGSIFYYDGNLTINAGVTVTINNNVQLRIRGALTINGDIDGVANGPAGGAATTSFVAGATTPTFDTWLYSGGLLVDPLADQSIDYGSDGWFGVVQSGGSFDIYSGQFSAPQGQPPAYTDTVYVATNLSEVQADKQFNLPRKGSVSTMPYFDIENPNGSFLTGLPSDLRGQGGPGGIAMTTSQSLIGTFSGNRAIRGNGGGGGAGGAGLMITCRGMSFGGSGLIDLSGGDSTAPTGYAIGGVKTFWGGHGAPGSPGAMLVCIDGQYTNPDITSLVFVANMGSVVGGGGATEIGLSDWPQQFIPNVVDWPWTSTILNKDSVAAIQDNALWQSAHRLQYLPEAEEITSEFAPRVLERGKLNEIYFAQKTPAVNEFFGNSAAITSTGERFAASDSSATQQIRIFRNVKNPYIEQTFTLPGGSADDAETISFDALGSRLFVSVPTYTGAAAFQGRFLIYSRSTATWTLEQTIVTNGTPAVNDVFGRYADHNVDGDKLVIARPGNATPSLRLEYWTRSGVTWTFQSNIAVPSGATSTGWPSAVKMSGDGKWLYVGDDDYPAAATPAGRLHMYELVAGTWTLRDSATVPDYDVTIPIKFYQLTKSTTTRYGQNIQTNFEGTSVACLGDYDLTPPLPPIINRWFHVFERQGDKLKYIQGDDQKLNGWATAFDIAGMSDNGLVLLTKHTVSPGAYQIWRRNNISEGFGLVDSFKNQNDGPFSTLMNSSLSSSGQFVIVGEPSSDFNASSSGHIEIWEYFPEAD